MEPVCCFRLDLPLMAKARPRCCRNRPYMPGPYKEWQSAARESIREVWNRQGLPTLQELELLVEVEGPARSDGDNLIGALLDAGLPHKASGWSGAWRGDHVAVLPRFAFSWRKSRTPSWSVCVLPPGSLSLPPIADLSPLDSEVRWDTASPLTSCPDETYEGLRFP